MMRGVALILGVAFLSGASQADIVDLEGQSVCEFVASELSKPRTDIQDRKSKFYRDYLADEATFDVDHDGADERLEVISSGSAHYAMLSIDGEHDKKSVAVPEHRFGKTPNFAEFPYQREKLGFLETGSAMHLVVFDDDFGERATAVFSYGSREPEIACGFEVSVTSQTAPAPGESSANGPFVDLESLCAKDFESLSAGVPVHSDEVEYLEQQEDLFRVVVLDREAGNEISWRSGTYIDQRVGVASVDAFGDEDHERIARLEVVDAGGRTCHGQRLRLLPTGLAEPTYSMRSEWLDEIQFDLAGYSCSTRFDLMSLHDRPYLMAAQDVDDFRGPRRDVYVLKDDGAHPVCKTTYRFDHTVIFDLARGITEPE